jgi:hypothetical protein
VRLSLDGFGASELKRRAQVLDNETRQNVLDVREQLMIVCLIVKLRGKYFHLEVELWQSIDEDRELAAPDLAAEVDNPVPHSPFIIDLTNATKEQRISVTRLHRGVGETLHKNAVAALLE